jgi:hypothetical protein
MHMIGVPTHPELLRWSVRCDKSREPFASIGIAETAARAWSIAVPENCQAQWLELSGQSGDVALQSDITIHRLSLKHAGADA